MKKIKFLKLLIVLPFLFAACTDLDETFFSEISPDRIPTEQKIRAVYSHLKGSPTSNPKTCPWWKMVYAVQTSTDEICIPVQNVGDWPVVEGYVDMQHHTWSPSGYAAPIFHASWNYCYNIISNCNILLVRHREDLSNEGRAELQTLRAYAYYRLLDLFGNVPLITEDNFGQPQMPQNTRRADLFHWIEGQLTYIKGTELSVEEHLFDRSFSRYGTMTKGVLQTLKARMYLNSNVFLGLADDSQEYKNYLNKAILACNDVINSGQYQLESNVFANWYLDNGPHSREIIFAIPFMGDGSNEGNELYMETLIPQMREALGNVIGQSADGRDIIGAAMYVNGVSGWHVNPPMTETGDTDAIFNKKHNGYYGLFHENDNRRLAVLTGQLYNRAEYVRGNGFKKLIVDGYWDVNDELNPYGTENATPGASRRRQEIHANLAPWFYNRGFSNIQNDATKNVPKAFGARIIKFELAENPQFYSSPVHMVVMRLAEVYYTRAEAYIRLGDPAAAKADIQKVLQHRGFNPTTPPASYTQNYPFQDMDTDIYGNDTEEKISAVALMSKRWLTGNTQDISNVYLSGVIDLELMDQEWRREFIFEDRRRTDMIRMGKFAGPNAKEWGNHTKTTDPTRNLFPIPQVIIDGNPAVKQNPGYDGYDGWLN